jgi:hypothetical protein
LEWTVAIAATAIGIALHGLFAHYGSALWRDEVGSLRTASAEWPDLWRLMEFESFPPLWDVLLRGWLAVGGGTSDTTLRLFGSLWGVVLLAAVWLVFRSTGRAVPLVSLALLAVNPEVVRWSASLRPWSLGAALGLLMAVLVFKATHQPDRRTTVAAALVSIIAVQALYQNAILLAAAIGCSSLPWIRRSDWKRVGTGVAIGGVAAVSLLPYVGIMSRRADWHGLGASPVTLTELIGKLWELVTASGPLVGVLWCALPVAAVVATFATRLQRDTRVCLIGAALLGAAGILLFYLQLGYPTQRWYYLSVAAQIAVLTEAALAVDLTSRLVRHARVGMAVIALAAGTWPAIAALRVPQTTMNVVATIVTNGAQPGDLVVVSPWYFATSFTYYYRGTVETMAIPPLADIHIHRYDLLKQAMSVADALHPLRDRLQKVLESGHRVWIVGGLIAPQAGAMSVLTRRPPLPETGWNSQPYEEAWMMEIAVFLGSHAKAGVSVPTPDSVRPFESPGLTVMQGWK